MRHEKSALLIELARELANTRIGLTLDEMCERMSLKRRTIERMRDRLMEMFDTMEEIRDPPTKRWIIRGKLDGFLQSPTTKELAALKTAQNYFENQNTDAAISLKGLENKMLAAIGSKLSRLAPDIEALMQAEAIALNPGPRPFVDPIILNTLRDAILSLHMVRFKYDGGTLSGQEREVIPYGILFGGETYLIAVEPISYTGGRPRVWRLDKIRNIKISENTGAAPEDFNLKEFAERSFGVFQEDNTYLVRLLIAKEFADEAKRWVFHPKQIITEMHTGEVEISMMGGGLRELAWSLFRWGGKMKILEPKELINEFKNALKEAAKLID